MYLISGRLDLRWNSRNLTEVHEPHKEQQKGGTERYNRSTTKFAGGYRRDDKRDNAEQMDGARVTEGILGKKEVNWKRRHHKNNYCGYKPLNSHRDLHEIR